MPREEPLISILLPCRDAALHVEECVESLDRQTEGRFEVLAIDDASRDETPLRLAAWARRDPRVRLLTGPGQGLVAALAAGTAEARGEYLARMDADDVSHAERLEAQLALLATRPELAGCGTGVRYFPRDGLGSGHLRYERWLNGLNEPDEIERDLFVECPVAHPSLMLRRDAFDAVGGYRAVDWPEDYDLVLRLHARGYSLGAVARPLLDWRAGPGRLSMTSRRYSPSAFRRCKVHFLLSGFLPAARDVVVWGAGRVGKSFARELIAQAGPDAVSAFVELDPRKIGQEIHGAPVLGPDRFNALVGRARADERLPYVLIAVGSPGARHEIREALAQLGLRELVDFRAVA